MQQVERYVTRLREEYRGLVHIPAKVVEFVHRADPEPTPPPQHSFEVIRVYQDVATQTDDEAVMIDPAKEPEAVAFEMSSAVDDLLQTIERDWARQSHVRRASLDLAILVDDKVRQLATAVDSDCPRIRAKLDEMIDELEMLEVDVGKLPYHLHNVAASAMPRVRRGLVASLTRQIVSVVKTIRAEYAGPVHMPRPRLPHHSSSVASKSSVKSSTTDATAKQQSVEHLCATMEHLLPHDVPKDKEHHEPREALDELAEATGGLHLPHLHHHDDLKREFVILTAGVHRAEDAKLLFK